MNRIGRAQVRPGASRILLTATYSEAGTHSRTGGSDGTDGLAGRDGDAVRTRSNQDSLRVTTDFARVVAVLSDGMGGLAEGDRASAAALQAAEQTLHAATGDSIADLALCVHAASQAHTAVRELSAALERNTGATLMTALTCGLTGTGSVALLITQVGDSIAVLLDAHGRPRLVGLPHTARDRDGNPTSGLVRHLGAGGAVQPDVHRLELGPGQMLLLLTDGVWKHLTQRALSAWWAASLPSLSTSDLDLTGGAALAGLCRLALQHGSTDDRSAVLLAHPQLSAARRPRRTTNSPLHRAARAGQLLVQPDPVRPRPTMRTVGADTEVDLVPLPDQRPVQMRLSGRMLADLSREPDSRAAAQARTAALVGTRADEIPHVPAQSNQDRRDDQPQSERSEVPQTCDSWPEPPPANPSATQTSTTIATFPSTLPSSSLPPPAPPPEDT